jgi:hypothetical protein
MQRHVVIIADEAVVAGELVQGPQHRRSKFDQPNLPSIVSAVIARLITPVLFCSIFRFFYPFSSPWKGYNVSCLDR